MSPNILILKEQCTKNIYYEKWFKENYMKLKNYNILDNNSIVHHHLWIYKVGQMYSNEPSMKTSLLHSLMQFTFLEHNCDVNAPASPKRIAFFQTLHALSPTFYRLFSKNFGGYNEQTL